MKALRMNAYLALLLLPYTRLELLNWGKLMNWAGIGWTAGTLPGWKALPPVVIRGKDHRLLMKLDRSDWAQRITYFIGRYYEQGVLWTLDRILKPGDHFVDVGSNIGMIMLHARSCVGVAGRVDCFEPNPKCVSALLEHVRLNDVKNVFVHPFALSDKESQAELNLTSEHTGTATLAPVGRATQTIFVSTKIGDRILVGSPRAIKIDVEGFELHVLKGLQQTLMNSKPFIITELIETHLNKAGTSVREVVEFLRDLGYESFGIDIVRRRMRHHLVLRRGTSNNSASGLSDVLWVHQDMRASLKAFSIRV